MKLSVTCIAPLVAAAVFGAAVGLAPVASADSGPGVSSTSAPTPSGTGPDPLVPYGTFPVGPHELGYVNPNHDEANTTNGEVDVPF